jgi:SH3-like domain-containing protein
VSDQPYFQARGQEIHDADNPKHDSSWPQEVQPASGNRRDQCESAFCQIEGNGKGWIDREKDLPWHSSQNWIHHYWKG